MTIFDEMVEALHPHNKNEKESAQQEVMQQIALYGLYRGGFFDHAAFYGDTCLRIFHNGVEKRWIGDGLNHGGIKDEVTVTFDQYLDVKKGDEILFAVNGEGNDAWDGGRLEVDITPAD